MSSTTRSTRSSISLGRLGSVAAVLVLSATAGVSIASASASPAAASDHIGVSALGRNAHQPGYPSIPRPYPGDPDVG
jgi:hypothetical protein